MKKIKYLLLIIVFILLSACSKNQVDTDSAKNTAEYINKELGYETEVEKVNDDFESESHVAYLISEDIRVRENNNGSVGEIEFANTEEDEIDRILEIMKFPKSDSINRVITDFNSTEFDTEYENYVNMEAEFITHEDLALFIAGLYAERNNYESGLKSPYYLIFTYNEDTFDYWINAADMFSD